MADPEYFTTAEFRALSGMQDSEKYTEARILAAAASLTATVELEVGTSFVARNVTETVTTCGEDALTLRTPYVRSITTMTLNGVSVTVADLFVDSGVVRYEAHSSFTSGQRGNAVIVYVAGYSTTAPANIKEALMWATRDRLLATSSTAGIEARKTSVITDQGTMNFVLAGLDHPTGYPELDAATLAWKRKLNTVTYP